MTVLLIVFVVLCAIVSVLPMRVLVVYEARMAEIKLAAVRAQEARDRGETDWPRFYKPFKSEWTYHKQLFDLTKWRHASFYPQEEKAA